MDNSNKNKKEEKIMVNKAKLVAAFTAAHSKIMAKKGQLVTLTKTTETLDTEGRVTAINEVSDWDVTMVIQPLSKEDKDLVGGGVSIEGYMKAYCNKSYDLTNLGDNTEVEEGDKIKDRLNIEYRVEEIVGKETVGGTEIYRKLFLRRLVA